MEDLELEIEQIGKEMKFCQVCGEILTGNQTKYCKSIKCKNKAINALTAKRAAERVVTYPQYMCQHCGYVMQLDFEPRLSKNIKIFNELTCPECGNKRNN